MWLLRHLDSGVEYVVDLIAERKRVGDLFSSLKDGRMREQRWRMKRSGLTRRMYIIEGDIPPATDAQAAVQQAAAAVPATAVRYSIPLSTLESVLSSLSVVHGYSVLRTSGASWTVALLGQLHRQLEADLRDEGVLLREEYKHFEERMRKRGGAGGGGANDSPHSAEVDGEHGADGQGEDVERLRVWGSQLRMIRGISPSIAASIVAQYPSLASLRQAYARCGDRAEEEALLAELAFGLRKGRIGIELSRRVRDVLRLNTYHADEWKQVTDDREREEREAKERRKVQQSRKRREREDGQQRAKEQRRQERKGKARQEREAAVQQQQQQQRESGEARRMDSGGARLAVGHGREASDSTSPQQRVQQQQRQRRERRRSEDEEPGPAVAWLTERLERVGTAAMEVEAAERTASWQLAGQTERTDVIALSELRDRVRRKEREERRERAEQQQQPQRRVSLVSESELGIVGVGAAGRGSDARKLTARQRLRRREVTSASSPKRTRPRRGVIEVCSDEDRGDRRGASSDEDGRAVLDTTLEARCERWQHYCAASHMTRAPTTVRMVHQQTYKTLEQPLTLAAALSLQQQRSAAPTAGAAAAWPSPPLLAAL